MPDAIPVDDPRAFSDAVQALHRFWASQPQARRLRTGNFAVATAVLLHRLTPDATGGGKPLLGPAGFAQPLTTGALQTDVCDATWAKDEGFLPSGAQGPIYKPFTTSFKPRSPATNNWRHCFDLQAGMGCDAPYTADFLGSPEYIAERRFDCVFRQPETGRCESPAGLTTASRTCFNPNKRDVPPGPDTNAQHTPKLLTRGEGADGRPGYWIIEPTLDVLVDLLGSASGRVPLHPFATALYAGSPYWNARGSIASGERLEADLALPADHFLALFDPDETNEFNAAVLRHARRTHGAPSRDAAPPPRRRGSTGLSAPVSYKAREPAELRSRARGESDPSRRMRLLERATSGHRRALNALAADLVQAGYDVDEQLDGYDLRACHGELGEHLFEVKTWTPANLAKQVRAGWAQLYEYRHRNALILGSDVGLYLVLDRRPSPDFWAWPWLSGSLGVVPCWIHGGQLTTFPDLTDRLPTRSP